MATTTLSGNTWVGDSEPTTGVLACQQWIQPTSGAMSYRDTTNTVWTPFGNVNNNFGGAVMASGDTMTGPLLDAPNLPPLDSPNFLGTIDQDGFPVALQIDLSNLQKDLYDQISTQVRQQFLSQFQQSTTASDIAFLCSTFQTQFSSITSDTGTSFFTIPYATFKSDGAVATPDQELGYGWAVESWSGTGTSNGWTNIVESAAGSRSLIWNQTDWGNLGVLVIRYWSLAVR